MRVQYLDAAKAIGIVLMVIGHCILTMHKYPHFQGFIYTFHMPLFFLISGMLVKRDFDTNPIRKYASAYLCPYLITCVVLLSVVGMMQMMGYIPHDGVRSCLLAAIYVNGAIDDSIILGDFYSIGPLWFLFALFWAQTIYFYINKYSSGLNRLIYVFGVFSLGWLSSLYIRLPLSTQAGMCALLFLEIGYHIKRHDVIEKINGISPLALLCLCLIYLIGWTKGDLSMAKAQYTLPLFCIMGSVIATVLLLALLKKAKVGGVLLEETPFLYFAQTKYWVTSR